MGGQGEFSEPRLGIDFTLPSGTPDLVKPKLDALRDYQLSLARPGSARRAASTPRPPRGGGRVFTGGAVRDLPRRRRAHRAPTLHAPGGDGDGAAAYAARSASKRYRATPLRGLWQHPPYFHDGTAATLEDVVEHYDRVRVLGLSAGAEGRPRRLPEVVVTGDGEG